MTKRTRQARNSKQLGKISQFVAKKSLRNAKKSKTTSKKLPTVEELLKIPTFLKRKSSKIDLLQNPVEDTDTIWVTQEMRDALKQEKKDEADVKAVKSVKFSIQEAMREKLAGHLGEIEAMVDNFTENGVEKHELFSYLKKMNVAQVHARKIADYYRPFVLEMEELMHDNADKQLKEGFSHLKKKDIIVYRNFYQSLIDDANAQVHVKRATRKSRKRKAPSKEKIVARVNYLKESTELKVSSIQPIEILGSQQLWVFNTKTRKLIQYVASDQSGLFIKGTTIMNYNMKKSTQKTIRKPKQAIKDVINAGKVKLRRILGKVHAKETTPKGRLNKYSLILKSVK